MRNLLLFLLLFFSTNAFSQSKKLTISKALNAPSNPVKSGQAFTYLINFSIIDQTLQNIKIEDNIPSELEVLHVSFNASLWNLQQASNVVLDYIGSNNGPPPSGQIEIQVKFKNGVTCDGTTVSNRASISGVDSMDNEYSEQSQVVNITAESSQMWTFDKYHDAGDVIDNIVIYELRITDNSNQDYVGGQNAMNAKLVDVIPPNAIMVGDVIDRYNNTVASSLNGNILTIPLGNLTVSPSQTFLSYYVTLKFPSSDYIDGDIVNNSADFIFEDNCGNEATLDDDVDVTLTDSIGIGGAVYKSNSEGDYYKDDFIPGCEAYYTLTFLNTSNIILTDVDILDNLPSTLPIKIISADIFSGNQNQTIVASTSSPSCGTLFTSVLSGNNQFGIPFNCAPHPSMNGALDIQDLNFEVSKLAPNEYISIIIHYEILHTDILGNSLDIGYEIENCMAVNVQNTGVLESCTTYEVEDVSTQAFLNKRVLNSFGTPTYNIDPVTPGTKIRYRMNIYSTGSTAINNIKVSDILDSRLEYCGNVTYGYNIPNSNSSNYTPIPPLAVMGITDNSLGQNVAFNIGTLKGECNERNTLSIEFDALVKTTASTQNDNFICNNFSITADNYGQIMSDVNKISVTNLTDVLPTKFVQNNGDIGFSTDVISQVGNVVRYQLNLENIGNTNLHEIVLVDFLPQSGDMKILDYNTSRGSDFTINLNGAVQGLGTIEYRTDLDPDFSATFGLTYPMGSTRTMQAWDSNLPADPNDVRSIKITFPPAYILAPGDTESFIFVAVVPVGTDPNSIACNSFAYKVTNANSGIQLLPGEIIGGCITVDDTGCCIGNFIWDDTDINGIQDVGEVGVNGVSIHLIDNQGNPILSTTTSNNNLGEPGYYSFCGVLAGSYQVMIDMPTGYYLSDVHVGTDVTIDSDIDPNTLLSNPIIVHPENSCSILDVDVAISTTAPPVEPYPVCEGCNTGCYDIGNNLVSNPSFENGNSGFTTSVPLSDPGTPCEVPSYDVVTSPQQLCTSFPNIADHTYGNGTGNMMVVDGFNTPNGGSVWNTLVNVVQGKTYNFSAWVTQLTNGPDIYLSLNVNNLTGENIDFSNELGEWQKTCYTWESPITGTIDIGIYQILGEFNGYDYAIDDICFSEKIPRVEVEIGSERSICVSDNPSPLFTNADVSNGNSIISWTPANLITNSSGGGPAFFNPTSPGIYDVVLTVFFQECQITLSDTIVFTVIDCDANCSCNTSCHQATSNIISNGHFEFGYSDFGSELHTSSGGTCSYGFHMVGSQASELCSNFSCDKFDHTFGTSVGDFLLIDGDQYSSKKVYFTTVDLVYETVYDFNFWMLPFNNSNYPVFEIWLDNRLLGTIDTENSGVCDWVNHCISFNSGDYTGMQEISIVQINNGASGYDYGLDDICLSATSTEFALESATTHYEICQGSNLQLEVSPLGNNGAVSYSWTESSNLSSGSISNPIFHSYQAGTYELEVIGYQDNECYAILNITIEVLPCDPMCNCDIDECIESVGPNMIWNGNFEQGVIGFDSELNPLSQNCERGTFSVANNPSQHCTNFNSMYYDATLGTGYGHMLVIDGDPFQVKDVLSYNVFLQQGMTYNFSFHLLNITSLQNYSFDIISNDVVIGSIASNSISANGTWHEFCFDWVSLISGNTTIVIRQNNPTSNGTDYAIDEVCLTKLNRKVSVKTSEDLTLCLGESITLETAVMGSSANIVCNWNDGTFLDDISFCSPQFTASMVGDFQLILNAGLNDQCYDNDTVNISVVDCATMCLCPDQVTPIDDLVVNGDFEDSSIPVVSMLPLNCNCQSGSYCVTTNSRAKCTVNGWNDIFPPSGAGSFLVVDGNNGSVWAQSLNVIAGATYNFSFDLFPNISGDPSPTLQVVGNGSTSTTIVDNITAPATWPTTNGWSTISGSYTAVATETITLSINQLSGNGYSDYGIDNICFTTCTAAPICENNQLANGDFSVDNWSIIGTPQFVQTDQCNTPNSMQMWGNQIVGEGIQQSFNFEQGESYEISFCGKWMDTVQDSVRIRFRATQGTPVDNNIPNYFDCNNGVCEDIWLSPVLDLDWNSYTSLCWTPDQDYNNFVVTTWNNHSIDDGSLVSWARIDDLCVTSCSPVSTNEDQVNDKFSIFPNPTTSQVTIQSAEPVLGKVLISLYDITGRKITELNYDLFTNESTINLHGIKSGVYLLEMKNANSVVFRSKIIKI